jgi:hypothetical protein
MRFQMWMMGCLLVLVFALPAPADAASRWWDLLPKMNDKDIALAKEAAREQLGGQAVGKIVRWNNPETGNSGAVKLLESYTWDDQPCRRVVHKLEIKGQEHQIWEIRICKIKSGEWKFPVPPKRLF